MRLEKQHENSETEFLNARNNIKRLKSEMIELHAQYKIVCVESDKW